MPAQRNSASTVAARVKELLNERREHQEAIDRIDKVLHNIETALGSVSRGTRGSNGRAGSTGAGGGAGGRRRRRKRRSFAVTGEQSVLDFVRSRGKPTGREIESHWKDEGRGGYAANTLSRLVKERRLKREPVKDGRGSRYVLS